MCVCLCAHVRARACVCGGASALTEIVHRACAGVRAQGTVVHVVVIVVVVMGAAVPAQVGSRERPSEYGDAWAAGEAEGSSVRARGTTGGSAPS